MKRLLTAILLSMAMAMVGATGWPEWIGVPSADGCSQVFFRRQFTLSESPRWAVMTLAAHGSCVAFINGYNVSAAMPAPVNAPAAAQPTVVRYDVRHLLHAGTNVVALWYAPSEATARQVALMLEARPYVGEPTVVATDEAWLCRKAHATASPDGRETVDARLWQSDWNSSSAATPCWQWAAASGSTSAEAAFTIAPTSRHWRAVSTRPPLYYEQNDSALTYHFATPTHGWVRATIRGASRGDTIRLGTLTYVCAGKADEQACRLFTAMPNDPVTIILPRHLSPANIVNVEAIEVKRDL